MNNIKKGDFVLVTKGGNGFKKGDIAVVRMDGVDDNGEVSIVADHYKLGYASQPITEGEFGWHKATSVQKISRPKFAVVWSNPCNDPVMLFQTLKEANAFKAKLQKNRNVLAVAVYKQ